MDAALEPDFGMPPEQARQQVGRMPGARAETDVGGNPARVQSLLQGPRGKRLQSLIGVDVQYPVAAAFSEAEIAGRGEIIGPGKVSDEGAMRSGDLHRVIIGAGIDDDDFVNLSRQRFQAFAQHGGFVPDDKTGRQPHHRGMSPIFANPGLARNLCLPEMRPQRLHVSRIEDGSAAPVLLNPERLHGGQLVAALRDLRGDGSLHVWGQVDLLKHYQTFDCAMLIRNATAMSPATTVY